MRKIWTVMVAISVILLAACSLEPPEWAKSTKEMDIEDITIGLSVSTLNNPFFVSLKDGVVAAAEENGMKTIVVDAQDDSATQVSGIEDLIQQGADILLINPTDSAAISTAVEYANSVGIPVITLDRSSDSGDIVTLVASDNEAGGQMAAEYIIELLGENAVVAELEGTPGASATRERGAGFHSVADEKLQIVSKQTADFDRTQGLNVMENMIQGNGNIQAVFAHNDEMALGALEAINSAGKNLIVIGFDGTEDALASIRNGQLTATVAQQPVLMGEMAVQAAIDYLEGKDVEEVLAAPLKLVTQDNINQE
ncbi:MAG: D-ribose ABC transporter substrate-binding protein [Bacillus sp. (in: firmicutes)]